MTEAAAAEELAERAREVLRANDEGGYTVPSRKLYPHQWNWDSALIALGWATFAPERAWRELDSLAGAADRTGMIPHIAFSPKPLHYQPSPEWWGGRRGRDGRFISGITQNPVAAICLRLLMDRCPDEQRARDLVPILSRWHGALLGARDPEGRGEPVTVHPWETRDNAIEWDAPLARVVPAEQSWQRHDTEVVSARQRPTADHYRRYASLVELYRSWDWDQRRMAQEAPFRVIDCAFSAMLAAAATDLASVAEQVGAEDVAATERGRADRVAMALRARLHVDGMPRNLDLVADEEIATVGVGQALTVLCPQLPETSVASIAELCCTGLLSSRFGVRSAPRDDPRSSEVNYWRGPTWSSVTWLCALGLERYGYHREAAELRARQRAAVQQGGMSEYFDPRDGGGLGGEDFSWTAALFLWEADTRRAPRGSDATAAPSDAANRS